MSITLTYWLKISGCNRDVAAIKRYGALPLGAFELSGCNIKVTALCRDHYTHAGSTACVAAYTCMCTQSYIRVGAQHFRSYLRPFNTNCLPTLDNYFYRYVN
jgi:hypothetical protein